MWGVGSEQGMSADFSGQRALVSGGTRGIGRAIVAELLERGASVCAIGTDEAKLSELARELGSGVAARRVDLSQPSELAAAARDFAGEKFDILVNCAGINFHGLVGELDFAVFDRIQALNVRAPAVLCDAIVPGMAERGFGRVVNVTSIFSVVSKSRRASYTTSKFALLGFTRALALDYADRGIIANCVAPGFIETEMTQRMLGPEGIREITAQVPMNRLGQPREIARLVAFLASRDNSFVTGQNIVADGGFTST